MHFEPPNLAKSHLPSVKLSKEGQFSVLLFHFIIRIVFKSSVARYILKELLETKQWNHARSLLERKVFLSYDLSSIESRVRDMARSFLAGSFSKGARIVGEEFALAGVTWRWPSNRPSSRVTYRCALLLLTTVTSWTTSLLLGCISPILSKILPWLLSRIQPKE